MLFFYIDLFQMKGSKGFEVLLNELILVNHNDRFIRSVDKWHAHSNKYLSETQSLPHRAFSIFLFNQQNQLLLQKRSIQKKTFPLCWTNSCCSHPNMVKDNENGNIQQEPIRKSLHRALIRQLQMHIPNQQFFFMQKILYKQKGEGTIQFGQFEVDYVFLAKISENVKFKAVAEQIDSLAWVRKDQLGDFIEKTKLAKGQFTPWFTKMYESKLIYKWWDMAIQNRLENQPGEDKEKVINML